MLDFVSRGVAQHRWGLAAEGPKVGQLELHCALRARPDRIEVLAAFLDRCEREHAKPTLHRLEQHLGTVKTSRIGITDRISKLAAHLGIDELSDLIDDLMGKLWRLQAESAA
jgi:hypothetical protein